MSLCTHCRLALRQSIRRPRFNNHRHLSTKPFSIQDTLSKPTWSVRSLLDGAPSEPITPHQLRHLLRLAALPLPRSSAEEKSMIATLQSQLRFVRAVQSVDTEGVEPLRAIRDETEEGVRENTISLDDLRDALGKEKLVGHYKRPRRVRGKVESDAEGWDVLGTASRKDGRYFVVESGKKEGGEG